MRNRGKRSKYKLDRIDRELEPVSVTASTFRRKNSPTGMATNESETVEFVGIDASVNSLFRRKNRKPKVGE